MSTRVQLDVGATTLSALVRGHPDAPPGVLLHGLGEQAGRDRAARSAPTLIVGGGPANHIPQNWLAEAATRLPDARLVTLPVGHHVHTGDPDGFRDVLLDLLGVSAATGGSRPATPA